MTIRLLPRRSRRALAALVTLLGCGAPRLATAQVTRLAAPPGPRDPGVAQAAAPPVREAPAAADLLRRLQERVARPGGLTSGEAARRAVLTSNEDRSRRADVEVATSEVERAKVGYYPRVTLTARYTRLSPITPPEIRLGAGPGNLVGTPSPPGLLPAGAPLVAAAPPAISFPVILDQYLAQANVTVPVSDYLLRIQQNHEAALASHDAAELGREAGRRTTAAQARLAYYAWAGVLLQQAVTEQSVEQAERHLELARAGHDTGRSPDVDVLRAESLVASTELMNERVKNAGRLAEARLRTLLHDGRPVPYEVGEDLLAPVDAVEIGSVESLRAEALSRRPELAALARNDAALAKQRDAATSTGLPRLDAFGNAYVANPSPRVLPQTDEWRATWDLGVQLSWSPNDLGGSSATAHAVDAKRRKIDADRAALSDAISDEIAAARSSWLEARFAAATADRGLASAEEAYRVRRELFELGRGTDVELIDAETDVLRARLEMIQARVDARVAKVRLEHAVGRDVAAGP